MIYKLTCLIKNALQNTGYEPFPTDGQIRGAIEIALSEFVKKLKSPNYFPDRKYLAYPICPKCGGQTKLINENGIIKYVCKSTKCMYMAEAEIH